MKTSSDALKGSVVLRRCLRAEVETQMLETNEADRTIIGRSGLFIECFPRVVEPTDARHQHQQHLILDMSR